MILEQHLDHGPAPVPAAPPPDSAPVLLDPAIRDPLPEALAAPVPANDPRSAVPVRPFAARPGIDGTEVRLVPLGGFTWGGTGPQPARARGDHCLMRVTEGYMRVILPKGGADHGPGSVIFVPAGTAFAARPQPGVQGQALLMPRAAAARLDLPLPDRMVAGAGASDAFSADLAALAQRGGDPIAAATASCRIGLISATLNRLAAQAARPVGRRTDGAHALVADYLELAGRELGRGRTIADLAEALGTTAANLDRACRQQRGRSALDLLYDLRLERARAMLRAGGPSLSRVADDLGFTGVAHLNRVFMAATGRPADAFRRGLI